MMDISQTYKTRLFKTRCGSVIAWDKSEARGLYKGEAWVRFRYIVTGCEICRCEQAARWAYTMSGIYVGGSVSDHYTIVKAIRP